jgi:hypothetical protein
MSARRAILAALPGTAATLAQQTGYARSFVGRELAALHGAGLVHIACWEHTAKKPTAVHAAGQGFDMPPVKVVKVVRVPDCMVPRALAGQKASFPLAGVWA